MSNMDIKNGLPTIKMMLYVCVYIKTHGTIKVMSHREIIMKDNVKMKQIY